MIFWWCRLCPEWGLGVWCWYRHVPRLQDAYQIGSFVVFAGVIPGHYADVRRHLLQCHAGVPAGANYLAAGRTTDLARQRSFRGRLLGA